MRDESVQSFDQKEHTEELNSASKVNMDIETIIEIYDDQPINNLLSVTDFNPKNVVYIGSHKLKSKKIKNNIISCLRMLGFETKCFFYSTDMNSLDSLVKELTAIINNFPKPVIDITGGSEAALVAVGMLAKERPIRLIRYDRNEACYRNILDFTEVEGFKSSPHFTVESILRLSGAVLKEHGHLSIDELDSESKSDIFKIWQIYKSNRKSWWRLVSYLQQAAKREPESTTLKVNAPPVVFSGKNIANIDSRLMEKLSNAGIILDYRNGSNVSFRFKSELMRSCLIDSGICLELYVFASAVMSEEYDDVQISVVIDWDGDLRASINTLNEIDVILVKGQVPIFISCKSGMPNVMALNEIKTLTDRFGGENARAVLVTMADVQNDDPFLYQRAIDMGITLIDHLDLINDRLNKKLGNIARL